MIKKIGILNIITIVLLNCCGVVWADDKIEEINKTEINEPIIKEAIQTAATATQMPKIDSRYAIVLDRKSKAVLYGKKEQVKTKMASTTKIMTALVIIENTNLSNIVEVSKKAAATGGSRLKLKTGDKVSVQDLLYGLMLRSGNDAAVALAEHVAGSVSEFAKLMNEKAEELGLVNTHFETPHGLDSDEHYTTPYELALLTDYALNNKVFVNIVKTKSCSITINGYSRVIANTNELLGNLNGVYGVKTGFTNGAGRCLVTATKRGDLDVICVVLGADTKKIRTADSIKLIEYTFANFENIDIRTKIEEEFITWKNMQEKRINIEKGKKQGIKLKMQEYHLMSYPIRKNTEDKISIKMNANSNLIAPVAENTKVGEVTIFYEEHSILKIDILVAEKIEKKGILDYILEMTENYSNYLEKII